MLFLLWVFILCACVMCILLWFLFCCFIYFVIGINEETFLLSKLKDVEKAVYWVSFGFLYGNAVAVSENIALTALHCKLKIGTNVVLRDSAGTPSNAKVIFSSFVENQVVVVAVKLIGKEKFPNFIPLHAENLNVLQTLFVVGRKSDDQDENNVFVDVVKVNVVRKAPIVESHYVGCKGLSGSPALVVVSNNSLYLAGIHVDNSLYLAGIHVACDDHNDLETIKPIKAVGKTESASRKSVDGSITSVSRNSNDRTSFAMICEVRRVSGLLSCLQEHALPSNNSRKPATRKRPLSESVVSENAEYYK